VNGTIRSQISNLKPRIPSIIVWLLILAFVLTFATLSLRRNAALGSNGLDLGNVNQALWNTAHGDFLAFTNMAPVRNRLALHVEPILLLFVPFYWAGLGGPRLLLVVQAIIVGLGALPLYLLARDILSGSTDAERGIGSGKGESKDSTPGGSHSLLPATRPYSLLLIVFPLAYLLLPALEAAVMYDFHAVTLAPTFLLFAFYFGLKKRPLLFGLFVALALASKEDMGLTAAMLGLFMIIVWRRWRWGVATALVGVAWFAIAVFLIQPRFSPTGGNIGSLCLAGRYAADHDRHFAASPSYGVGSRVAGGEPAWLPGWVAAAHGLFGGLRSLSLAAGVTLSGHQSLKRQPLHVAVGGFSLCRTHRSFCPDCDGVWCSTAEQVGRTQVGDGLSVYSDHCPRPAVGRIAGLPLCAWFLAFRGALPVLA
jgi:hypothetical protein